MRFIAIIALCSFCIIESAAAASMRAYAPGQYNLIVNDTNESTIRIEVFLDAVEQLILDAAASNKDIRIVTARFENYGSGSPNLQFYADVDHKDARCEVIVRFAIPRQRVKGVKAMDVGSDAKCRSGSTAANVFGIKGLMISTIMSGIRNGLAKASKSNVDDWLVNDPDWAALVLSGHLQGYYCDTSSGLRALCLNVSWINRAQLSDWIAQLLTKLPKPVGPADVAAAKTSLDTFRAAALARTVKPSTRFPGYSYPVGIRVSEQNKYIEEDMSIFAGLLCASGEPMGCELLHRARDPSQGRSWRSPDLVGIIDKDHSSFSGDQFNGLATYLWLGEDDGQFRVFMAYANATRAKVPSPNRPLDTAGKSCVDDKNFECVLSGPEWHWLNRLAKKYNYPDYIPPIERDVPLRYGYDYPAMIWEAALLPAGFRLHLVGVKVLLGRLYGDKGPVLDQVAALLAARQPDNPFFSYLHLGSDKGVQTLANNQCKLDASHNEYDDWAWQRASSTHAWKNSMIWDCVFIFRLISGQKEPWTPARY